MKLPIPLTKKEQILGCLFVVAQLFIVPSVIALISDNLATPLTEVVQNFLFFAINFICVLLIFHRFLRISTRRAIAQPFPVLQYALWGLLLYYGSNFLVSGLIQYLVPGFANVNDDSVALIVAQGPILMNIGTVLLVPIVEETLYRGLIFGTLYRIKPVWGYVVSTVLFCLIHVLGYIWLYDLKTLFLCFVQYIPAGIFLGWSYARSGTIWCPILIHMTVNQTGMLLLR